MRWQRRLAEKLGFISAVETASETAETERYAAAVREQDARSALIHEKYHRRLRRDAIEKLSQTLLVEWGNLPSDPAGRLKMFEWYDQIATEYVDWRISKDARPATP